MTGRDTGLRVLVLSYETPAYPGAGGPSRQHSLLEPLADRHEIHVLSTGGQPAFGRPPRGVRIQLLDAPPGPPQVTDPWLRKNVLHYVAGRPWLHHLAAHHVETLAVALPAALEEVRPDVVQIEHAELAALLERLPARLPRVLVLHNLLTDVQRQNIRGHGAWQAVKAMLEVPLCRRQERRDAREATRVVVTTNVDADRLRRVAPHAAVDVVPNCVDLDYWRRDHGAPPTAPVALMTGSFHYAPNQRAAEDLLRNVWPRVRDAVPGAQLRLVGQRMGDSLRRLSAATPGAVAVGQVDDVRDELHRARASLALLRQGSGSPLKVIEALAAGTPVVATARVARALELGEADGVLCADDASGAARLCARLLADPAESQRLGAAGRAAAARCHDREDGARSLEDVWRAATGIT